MNTRDICIGNEAVQPQNSSITPLPVCPCAVDAIQTPNTFFKRKNIIVGCGIDCRLI